MGDGRIKQLKKIAADAINDEVKPQLNQRLDTIEEYVKERIDKMDKRAKAIEGFIVREVKFEIQNQIYNMQVTFDAFLEVLKENGVTIPDFAEKLDAKKVQIDEQRKKEAGDRLQAEMEQKAAEAQQSEPTAS